MSYNFVEWYGRVVEFADGRLAVNLPNPIHVYNLVRKQKVGGEFYNFT